jgi:anaerobic glycerol-3-phosphate dehydrogenase
MTWLDGKLAAFENDRRRDSDIKAHAPTLFSAVWEQIKIILQEANGKGFALKTNGNSERRSLEYTAGPTLRPTYTSPTEIVYISLSQDRHALEISGMKGVMLSFQIDPCADNIVCLHFEGTEKTPEEVAQIIMGRFLFGPS